MRVLILMTVLVTVLVTMMVIPIAQACNEHDLPWKLERLVDAGIVSVNYETEEVSCDTKRLKAGMCEKIGEEFALYFYKKRESAGGQLFQHHKDH
ncbi:MAG: hypothetical protein ACO1N8_06425 [Methylophilus sp.]